MNWGIVKTELVLKIFFFCFALGTSIFFTGNNLRAKFGPIDDHEIVNWLGPNHKIKITQIPAILATTELSQYGRYARYRPSYYVLRVGETYLWRDNTSLWYFARLIMFAVFVFLALSLITKYTCWPVAVFALLSILAQVYWGDILSRLGPSEIYAIFGISLYFFGFDYLWNNEKNVPKLAWISYFFGFIIAVGSKENFSFLTLFTIILVIKFWLYKNLNLKIILINIVMIIYSFLIFLSIILNTISTKSDIYGTNVSLTDRAQSFINMIITIIPEGSKKEFLVITLVLILLIISKIPVIKIKNIALVSLKYSFWIVTLFGIGFFQYIYYGAIFPTNLRYDFPLLLIPTLLLVIFSKYIATLLMIIGVKYSTYISYIACIIALFLYIKPVNFTKIHENSKQNVIMTTTFMNKLQSDARELRLNVNDPLIINSTRPIDYEVITSLQRYLNYLGIKNTIHLRYESKMEDRISPLGKQLDERLFALSTTGRSEYFQGFTQYTDNLLNSPCYTISIGYKANIGCTDLNTY